MDHFSDDDKAKVINFMNFVHKNATWKVKSPQLFEFGKLYSDMAAIVKKIEAHIYEIVETKNNELKDGKKAK